MQVQISLETQFLLPSQLKQWSILEQNLSAAREAIRKGDSLVLQGAGGPVELISSEKDLDFFYACL